MDCVCAQDSILNVLAAHLRSNPSALLATAGLVIPPSSVGLTLATKPCEKCGLAVLCPGIFTAMERDTPARYKETPGRVGLGLVVDRLDRGQ